MNKLPENFCICIPARYESSRFPGKPMANICSVPMVIRVARLAKAVSDNVFVVTDDERISDVCSSFGVTFILSVGEFRCGTERIAAVVEELSNKFQYVINVQGDEPLIKPEWILQVAQKQISNTEAVVNAQSLISAEVAQSAAVPKMAVSGDKLLYISRAPVPATKNEKSPSDIFYRQVCIYSFPRDILRQVYSSSVTRLESIEDIEVLRCLELGVEVLIETVVGNSLAVDFPEDIPLVEAVLNDQRRL